MQWFFWAFSSRFHQGKQQRCHFSTNIPGATRLWPWRWHPTVKASQKIPTLQKGHILRRDSWGPKGLDINNPFRIRHPRYHFCHPLQVSSKGLQLGRDENPAVPIHRKIHQARNFSKWQDAKWRYLRSLQGFVLRRSYGSILKIPQDLFTVSISFSFCRPC